VSCVLILISFEWESELVSCWEGRPSVKEREGVEGEEREIVGGEGVSGASISGALVWLGGEKRAG